MSHLTVHDRVRTTSRDSRRPCGCSASLASDKSSEHRSDFRWSPGSGAIPPALDLGEPRLGMVAMADDVQTHSGVLGDRPLGGRSEAGNVSAWTPSCSAHWYRPSGSRSVRRGFGGGSRGGCRRSSVSVGRSPPAAWSNMARPPNRTGRSPTSSVSAPGTLRRALSPHCSPSVGGPGVCACELSAPRSTHRDDCRTRRRA